MLYTTIITNSDNIIAAAVASPSFSAGGKSKEGCASSGSAHRAQCVLGIIRISWNYTVCLAGT